MALEPATEEKQQMLASMASEYGISEATAEACLIAAGWDPVGAQRIASMNRVEYLLVNFRFTGKNPIPHGGLLSILLRRGGSEPVHFVGLVMDGYEYVEQVSPHFPASDFLKAITHPNKLPKDETPWFRLRDAILLNIDPAIISHLFTLTGGKTSELTTDGNVTEHNDLKDALTKLLKPAIDNIYMESITLEISADFQNGFQYDNLMESFGQRGPEEKIKHAEKPPASKDEVFKVYLKGSVIIEPQRGVPVEDLQVGDTIICDIIDSQPVALQVGKMLGIYRRGVWFPAKGKIVELEDSLAGTKRITIRAGHGIYIITRALNSVRIRVSENELESILRRIEHQRDQTVRSAASMLPVVLVILSLALALTILLHRG